MRFLDLFRRHRARKRLDGLMKPNLEYAKRRAAQLPEPRRSRFLRNVGLA